MTINTPNGPVPDELTGPAIVAELVFTASDADWRTKVQNLIEAY